MKAFSKECQKTSSQKRLRIVNVKQEHTLSPLHIETRYE